MLDLTPRIFELFEIFLDDPFSAQTWMIFLKFVPFVVFFELPVYFVVVLGVLKYGLIRFDSVPFRTTYFPSVSCIMLCYAEGEAVQQTISTLTEQIYPGHIELLAVMDGAARNGDTLWAARAMLPYVERFPNRSLRILPKWQRGGRVSSLNTGFRVSRGEIIMALDGDTSFDNNMVERATRHFVDPAVGCVSGCLRVRNMRKSLATRLQAIEYFLAIQASKTGLSSFNMVNNISGAFGVFRRSVLELVHGWDTGTAEDLDLTIRVKHYFGRHKEGFRIVFDPEAIGFTDVPETMGGFLKQRLRWDGDLFYLYFRKHWNSFTPRLVGWRNFIAFLWTGLLFQIVMPLLILAYTVYIFAVYPLPYVLGTLFIIYVFYLVVLSALFFTFVALLSERPAADLRLSPYLFVMPLFTFMARLNSAFATLWEIFGRGSDDTSMAPWWVTRKGKF